MGTSYPGISRNVRFLATAGLPGTGFGHLGTQREICAGSRHHGTRRKCLCGIRPRRYSRDLATTGQKRDHLCGIWLPRYYTGHCLYWMRLHSYLLFLGTAAFGDHDGGTTCAEFLRDPIPTTTPRLLYGAQIHFERKTLARYSSNQLSPISSDYQYVRNALNL